MHPIVWTAIQEQIEAYAEQRMENERRMAESRRLYSELLRGEVSENWERWKQLAQQKHSHLIPDFDEPPGQVHAVVESAPDGVVMATDGSQIYSGRHEIAQVAMLHVSRIRINYADYEEAPLLDSTARLLLPDDIHREEEITGESVVNDRRTLWEIEILAELAEEARETYEASIPLLALTDGSLILWSIAGRHEKEYERSVVRQFVESLKRFQEAQVPVAGYISRPGSREVFQLLQMAYTQIRPGSEEKPPIPLTDALLFSTLLQPGQRSTLFHSRSQILELYGEQRVSSFYLNAGEEIARVEMPQWMAREPAWVDLAAAQCLRQARIGGGYPIVLSEAHEAAVVRAADRNVFFALLEQQLLRHDLFPRSSSKQLRKRASIL